MKTLAPVVTSISVLNICVSVVGQTSEMLCVDNIRTVMLEQGQMLTGKTAVGCQVNCLLSLRLTEHVDSHAYCSLKPYCLACERMVVVVSATKATY